MGEAGGKKKRSSFVTTFSAAQLKSLVEAFGKFATVDAEQPVKEGAKKMLEGGGDKILVSEGDKLLGVLELSYIGPGDLQKPIKQVKLANIRIVKEGARNYQLSKFLFEGSAIVVTSGAGNQIQGILTPDEIVKCSAHLRNGYW